MEEKNYTFFRKNLKENLEDHDLESGVNNNIDNNNTNNIRYNNSTNKIYFFNIIIIFTFIYIFYFIVNIVLFGDNNEKNTYKYEYESIILPEE